MPNHCANQLTVSGPEFDRKRFALQAFSEHSKLDLEQFIPMPFALSEEGARYPDKRPEEFRARLIEAFEADNWYEWRMKNWGTKWNCYQVEFTHDGDAYCYFFNTAWCPFSSSVLVKMSEMFPTLSFELLYGEIGCAFYGSMSASAGELGTCSQGSLDSVSFYDHETGKYTWPAHLSEDVIRLLESSG